jgi:hypothetical protein
MKKINKWIKLMVFCVAIASFSACRDDFSTLAINKIPGIKVDTTGIGSLSVFQFDRFQLVPKTTNEGIDEANLTYEWKVNLAPGDTTYNVVSTAKNLDFEVRLAPNVAGRFHQLVYTVTDKTNDLAYVTAWPLTVKNNIGEGLVIAHATANGNTDISHIMSPLVTPNFTRDDIKRNVFTAINGRPIDGLVKQMQFTNIRNTRDAILGITDNSIFSIKTLDYTLAKSNAGLLFSGAVGLQPSSIGKMSQLDLFVANGKLYGTWLAISEGFGVPVDTRYVFNGKFAYNAGSNNIPFKFTFYNEAEGNFLYLQGLAAFNDRIIRTVPANATTAFNATNVPNKIVMEAGLGVAGDFLYVLKDKTTSQVGLYVLSSGAVNNFPEAKSYFDLSNAPGISTATQFVLMDNQRVMYYISGTKLYGVVFSTSTAVVAERFTLPAGETATTFQVYLQADYPLGSSYLPTNNNQLILSTYNGSQGRVHLLPITNLGVGNIDQANIKTFGGFGRITAIATQK